MPLRTAPAGRAEAPRRPAPAHRVERPAPAAPAAPPAPPAAADGTPAPDLRGRRRPLGREHARLRRSVQHPAIAAAPARRLARRRSPAHLRRARDGRWSRTRDVRRRAAGADALAAAFGRAATALAGGGRAALGRRLLAAHREVAGWRHVPRRALHPRRARRPLRSARAGRSAARLGRRDRRHAGARAAAGEGQRARGRRALGRRRRGRARGERNARRGRMLTVTHAELRRRSRGRRRPLPGFVGEPSATECLRPLRELRALIDEAPLEPDVDPELWAAGARARRRRAGAPRPRGRGRAGRPPRVVMVTDHFPKFSETFFVRKFLGLLDARLGRARRLPAVQQRALGVLPRAARAHRATRGGSMSRATISTRASPSCSPTSCTSATGRSRRPHARARAPPAARSSSSFRGYDLN